MYFYFSTAMELLMKLKEALARLSKKKPKRLQKRVNACTSKCDEVLRKHRIEKTELERELESKNACIDDLIKQLDFYRQIIRSGKGKKFFGTLGITEHRNSHAYRSWSAPAASISINLWR